MERVGEENYPNEISREFSEGLRSDSTRKEILDILNTGKNRKNKSLAFYLVGEVDGGWFKEFKDFSGDKEFILLALKKKSDNFYHIDSKFNLDFDIAVQMIKTMIRESKSFIEIRDFVLKYFPQDKEKLFELYEQKLDKHKKVVGDDLTKILFLISKDNNDLIKNLENKKIIINKRGKSIINSDFIVSFNKTFLNIEGFLKKSLEEQRSIKKQELIKLLGIEKLGFDENIDYLINLILEFLFIKDQKDDLVEEEKENKKEETLKEKQPKEIYDDLDDSKDFFEDRMDLELGIYSYSMFGSYCDIKVADDFNLKISKEEQLLFTTKALDNYIKFYKLFYELGLIFLFERYNYKSLLNDKGISFDYTSGEGITEDKILRILNLIGKNIGVPEYDFLKNDGEIVKETKCFNTLSDAKLEFKNIKGSSMINGELIETNGNVGAVEKKLSKEGKLDFAKGIVNFTKWN